MPYIKVTTIVIRDPQDKAIVQDYDYIPEKRGEKIEKVSSSRYLTEVNCCLKLSVISDILRRPPKFEKNLPMYLDYFD